MAVNSTIGALLISPLLFTSDLSWLANPRSLGIALHLGMITTALVYGVFAKGLQLVSVHNAATLTAALLGILVVDEKLTPFAFSGILLIFAGLLILTPSIFQKNDCSGEITPVLPVRRRPCPFPVGPARSP